MSAEHTLVGRVIAGGVAYGPAYIVEALPSPARSHPLMAHEVRGELRRFDLAVARTQRHLQQHVQALHSPADDDLQQVVAAHLMILSDHHFLGTVVERIERDLSPAEAAVEDAYRSAAARLVHSRDGYLRARLEDLRDSCHMLLEALIRGELGFTDPREEGRGAVFVSPNLHTSVVLRARRAGAVGFISSSKAFLSHGAILLRASGIPSVGGLSFPAELINEGAQVLVDAVRGELVVEPTSNRREQAQIMVAHDGPSPEEASKPALDACTADGVRVHLWANIDNPAQTASCLDHRLHGIGLFRTEFMALADGWVPEEDEQVRIYRKVVELIGDRPIVTRTFDIGAEKVPEGLREEVPANPAMGLRGLRRHLVRYPEELRTQLRSILRGTVGSKATILFPMVTTVEDIRAALEHLEATREILDAEGITYNRDIKVASMIEVPAAALNVRAIAEEVDLLAIGTNDMSQYLTASDRDNAAVSGYLDPKGSGVLTIIAHVMCEMRDLGRQDDVFVGGELPSDPAIARELVQLGVRNLIVNPPAAPAVRAAISEVTGAVEARRLGR